MYQIKSQQTATFEHKVNLHFQVYIHPASFVLSDKKKRMYTSIVHVPFPDFQFYPTNKRQDLTFPSKLSNETYQFLLSNCVQIYCYFH